MTPTGRTVRPLSVTGDLARQPRGGGIRRGEARGLHVVSERFHLDRRRDVIGEGRL